MARLMRDTHDGTTGHTLTHTSVMKALSHRQRARPGSDDVFARLHSHHRRCCSARSIKDMQLIVGRADPLSLPEDVRSPRAVPALSTHLSPHTRGRRPDAHSPRAAGHRGLRVHRSDADGRALDSAARVPRPTGHERQPRRDSTDPPQAARVRRRGACAGAAPALDAADREQRRAGAAAAPAARVRAARRPHRRRTRGRVESGGGRPSRIGAQPPAAAAAAAA